MNIKIVFYVGGLLMLAMILIVSALSGGGNELGTIVKYICIGILVIAFVQPRLGFWVSIICMAYIDFIKRLLVLGVNLNFNDVTILLAFTPILIMILFVGVLLKKFVVRDFTNSDVRILIMWFLLSCMMGVLALGGMNGGMLAFLKSVSNWVGYIPIVFIVPYLYKTNVEVLRVLKKMIIIFLPVPIYAIYQKFAGFADFEIDYLLTGFSMESRIITGDQDFRYFSTMNSSQNLAKFASMFGAIALLMVSSFKSDKEYFKGFNIFTKIVLYLLFVYAGLASGARTGVIMGLIAIPAYFIFKSRPLTIFTYFSGVIALGVVIFSADYVINSRILHVWSSWLGRNTPEWLPFQSNLGTLTARFEGFSQWFKPDFWQPFGHSSTIDMKLSFPHHDALTGMILKLGYIPMFIVMAIGGCTMYKFHKNITQKGVYHENLYLSLALISCILVGSLATANLSSYPINLMLYLFIGFTIISYRNKYSESYVDKNN